MKPNIERPGLFEAAAWFCLVISGFSTWYIPHEHTRVCDFLYDMQQMQPGNREYPGYLEQARLAKELVYFGGAPTCLVISICAIGVMRTQRHCTLATIAAMQARPAATAEAIRAAAKAAKASAGPGSSP